MCIEWIFEKPIKNRGSLAFINRLSGQSSSLASVRAVRYLSEFNRIIWNMKEALENVKRFYK